MSHTRYFVATEEDIGQARGNQIFCDLGVAEYVCENLVVNTGEPWNVFECIVSLPGEGQYAGDRRELRRVCNLAHQEVQRITKQRDALMSICRDFDRWANGWCQQSKCCATSCAEIADRAREAMRLVAGSQTPKQETT